VSLYAHRLARIIERRSREAAGLHVIHLDGMTYRQRAAFEGVSFSHVGAAEQNRRNAAARLAVFRRMVDA